MRNKKVLRNIGLIAVAVFAVGLVGYAASNGSSNDTHNDGLAVTNGPNFAAQPANGKSVMSAGSVGSPGKALDSAGVPEAAPPPVSGSAASAPGAGPTDGGGALASTVDRKIVSTAAIQMQVDDVAGSFEEVSRIATSSGGFVASSSFSYEGEKQIASVTIRVPSESYQSTMASLRNLGVKVDAESSDANDVTEEYTDLGSRLRTLEATEQQLLTLLAKAETVSDILTVQDRLNYTRGDIEQVKGRMQLLDNLTDLATITVHLRPVVAGNADQPGNGVDLGQKVSQAWDDSLAFLGNIAGGVLTVVVFAWWLPLVGVPLLIGYKAVTHRRPHNAGLAD